MKGKKQALEIHINIIINGMTDSFKIGKGVQQGSILSPCLFNFYVEYFMQKLY